MKTTKLFFSIALVVLTATSFSQLSFNDRLFSKRNNEVANYTACYNAESNNISGDVDHAPVVSNTCYTEQVESIYEDELGMENWMTAPFESSVIEDELILEPWMAEPFETGLTEEELSIESWMTAPFEAAEEIEIEEWMTTAFI